MSEGNGLLSIATLEAGHYRIELPVPLSDSTHGTMTHFELITARSVQKWNVAPKPPTAARLAGGISLTCWVLVVIFGRWTGFTVMQQ